MRSSIHHALKTQALIDEATDLIERPTFEGGFSATAKKLRLRERPMTKEYGQAKVLSDREFENVMNHIDARSNVPVADGLKIELSCHQGLRVCEIAALTIEDVTDASGNIADEIRVSPPNSKNGKARTIPMTRSVKRAFRQFIQTYPTQSHIAISRRGKSFKVQSVNALTHYIRRLYLAAGLEGCSSHSGRRTFATELARDHAAAGCSLRDVQILLGHASLATTEAYIQPSGNHKPLVEIAGRKFRRHQ